MYKRNTIWLTAILATLVALQPARADRWMPRAQAQPQITEFAIGGTYSEGESISVTCNLRSVTVTAGPDNTSPADMAASMVAAINSDDKSNEDDDIIDDETKNIGGQQIPEFTDFSAEIDPNDNKNIILTSTEDGLPFTVSTSENSASGTIGTPSNSQEATGPRHFDNANNWEGGSVPATGTLTFDALSNSVPCIYGIGEDPNAHFQLYVTTDYESIIGLPMQNPKGYIEYRKRRLPFGTDIATTSRFVKGTKPNGTGCVAYLDARLGGTYFEVTDGGVVTNVSPRIDLVGSGYLTIYLLRGSVICNNADDPNASMTINDMTVGALGQDNNLTRLWVNGAPTYTNGRDLKIYSGIVDYAAKIDDPNANVTIEGGDITYGRALNTTHYHFTPPLILNRGVFRYTTVGFGTGGNAEFTAAVTIGNGGHLDLGQSSGRVAFNSTLTMKSGSEITLGGNSPTIVTSFTGIEPIKINP